jgi:TPR repeat protein
MTRVIWASVRFGLSTLLIGFACTVTGCASSEGGGGKAAVDAKELDADLKQAAATFAGGSKGKARFIALAEKRKEFWAAASEKGDARGQYLCALTRLVYGVGGSSSEEAFGLFRKSADQKLAEAQSALGSCYERGIGVKPDPKEAVRWYRKSAGQGYSWAQHHLGICYRNGKGVGRDLAKAFEWELKAANQGLVTAQTAVGYAYEKGEGVKPNPREAVRWYEKAARQGDAVGQMNLGVCHAEGVGTPRNLPEAKKWLRRAADQGEPLARRYLIQYGLDRD